MSAAVYTGAMASGYAAMIRCTGLPAGPISNPGLAAIKAALTPEPDEAAKNAYFFVTDLKGSYYYAHTLSEHNANCKTAAAVNKSMNTEK